MKPNIRFYETAGKEKSATVTIGKVKIYLHNIEWENPRELWFTVTCPEIGISPQAQCISIKFKMLKYTWFGDGYQQVELPCDIKISKKTYKDVIRKAFTSDKFKGNYLNVISNKIYDIDHEVTDIENRIVNLQKKIEILKDKKSKLNNSTQIL